MATVSIDALRKSFGDFEAVKELDLVIERGEFVTLLGPSGCGKTTTLRCVAGLEHPTGGRISIGNRVVADGARRAAVPPEKRDLGMVFQSYALWPHMTVEGNVSYPLKRSGLSRKDARSRAANMIELVGLSGKLKSSVASLSGGQQQRVALARALVSSPEVLLCDEPLSNLDASLRRDMRNQIRRLHDQTGTTCLYVTHDQEEAIALSDRIVVMQEGRATQIGTPREIFAQPRTEFIAKFVGIENVLPVAQARSRSDSGLDLVTTAGPVLTASAATSAPVVACAFRADDVRVADGDTGGINLLKGTVVSAVFVGIYTEVVFVCADTRIAARLLERDLERTVRPQVGEEHIFVVPPDGVIPLAAA